MEDINKLVVDITNSVIGVMKAHYKNELAKLAPKNAKDLAPEGLSKALIAQAKLEVLDTLVFAVNKRLKEQGHDIPTIKVEVQ